MSLTCPRAAIAGRIAVRAIGDTAGRLAAYDSTLPLPGTDLAIDTNATTAHDAARLIARVYLGVEGSE